MAVNLSALAGAGQQFLDNNGNPLSGGKLWSYESGTTTPQTTYTDAAGAVAHANPIILDASGRVAIGEIWLTAGNNYKFILTTSSDVLLATWDNITGINGTGITSNAVTVAYDPEGTGAVATTVQDKLRESVSVKDFGAVGDGVTDDTTAIQAAIDARSNGSLIFPDGDYLVGSNLDFGSTEVSFEYGSKLTVSAGVAVLIRKEVQAGNYEIFGETGNIVVADKVNPMWWGAVYSDVDPGATVAAKNTAAFRKAAKSFYTDYALVLTEGITFSVEIPAGGFYLSNGFAAAVGVPVRGQGVNTLLCRLTANADADTAIPLLTIGQTLGSAPTLAYDPVTQGESSFKNAGFPFTAAQAYNLYFVDQNPTEPAFKPAYPGVQFSDLFFTSCGIAIEMDGTADITGSNIIIDLGLTGISFGECQNIVLSNVIIYNTVAQSIVFNTNARDITINGFEIEYPQSMGIYFSEAQNNNDNIRFSNGMFVANTQHVGFLGMVHVRGGNCNVFFNNCSFRNVPEVAVNQSLGAAGVRLTFEDCTFDGLRTTSGYSQGSTMKAFRVIEGTFYFKGCEFKNLFAASLTDSGTSNLTFQSCEYSGMNYSGAVFNFASGAGTADFMAIKGDAISPLVSGNGLFTRVKGSFDWLGAPYASGANLAWDVPSGLGNQYMVTITARTNSALAAESRKSATYIVDRETKYVGPGFEDSLSSTALYRSPADGAFGQVTPTFVFLGGAATQPSSYPNPTTWKTQIPNTYADYKINIDFLD